MPEDARSHRRLEILKAARICFLDRGFLRTTISDVLALSGGSRATVYEEFGDKEGLFAALIASILDDMSLPALADGPPDQVLRELGRSYLEQLLDPDALALYRVVLGESRHMRQLGPAIFRAGPRAASDALARRFAAWIESGELTIENPRRAATLFLAMVEGDLHRAAVMWERTPSAVEIEDSVDAAVALFLRGAAPAHC
jgi:TetR/AcrR family transcriptional regulator, mexJK operon transcriptional repressor